MLEITNERRRSGRWRLVNLARVECRLGTLGSGSDVAAQAVDVGEFGMRILSREPLIAGEEVEILLHGAGLIRSVRRLGKVVWSELHASESVDQQFAPEPWYASGIAFARPIRMPTLRRLTRQNKKASAVGPAGV